MSETIQHDHATLNLPNDQCASGRTLGEEELALLREVILSGTLTSTRGTQVAKLEADFARRMGVPHAHACSSGTAAVHCAVAAVDPEPGDEIITSPITDMGAIAPILYQGAIPVFSDVDPATLNMTAATIERCLSPRTRAIIVTHLFGCPCDMDPILELARSRDIVVIEDCAQAFGATYKGRPVGTLGPIGCFSMQQGKHATTGEGGLVISTDPALARRMFLFINKAWGYGDKNPDHYFLALNYRLSELQGAVAVAQMNKLDACVDVRVRNAARLTEKIRDLAGVHPPQVAPGCVHTYWKYVLRVDSGRIAGGAPGMAAVLKEYGVASAPRYIQKPAFMCRVFQDQNTFGKSHYPFNLARPAAVDYARGRFPGSWAGLEQCLVLPWNERYTEAHVDALAGVLRETTRRLAAEAK
jgi:perosamine synthetase